MRYVVEEHQQYDFEHMSNNNEYNSFCCFSCVMKKKMMEVIVVVCKAVLGKRGVYFFSLFQQRCVYVYLRCETVRCN